MCECFKYHLVICKTAHSSPLYKNGIENTTLLSYHSPKLHRYQWDHGPVLRSRLHHIPCSAADSKCAPSHVYSTCWLYSSTHWFALFISAHCRARIVHIILPKLVIKVQCWLLVLLSWRPTRSHLLCRYKLIRTISYKHLFSFVPTLQCLSAHYFSSVHL